MALNFRRFISGIQLVGTSSTVVDTAGEMQYNTTLNKLVMYNGTSASSLVTEDHTATLTNKTLTSPTINSGTLSGTFNTVANPIFSGGVSRFGTNAGTGGVIGIPNNTGITFRNAANSANLEQYLDTSNRMNHPAQNLSISGTAAAPGWSWSSDPASGIYLIATSQVGFSTAGTLRGSINSSGAWIIGSTGGTQSHQVNGRLFTTVGSAGLGSFGTQHWTDITTDNVTKSIGLSMPHYNNGAQNNFGVFVADSTNTANTLYLGTGGTSSQNACTNIQFWTAATNTTTLGTLRGSISAAGLWTIGTNNSTETHIVNGTSLRVQPNNNGDGSVQVRQTNVGASASALVYLETAGSGDTKIQYFISGGADWAHGIDNSDSDSWVLSNSNTLGTNTYLKATTGGLVTIGASGSAQNHVVNGLSLAVTTASTGGSKLAVICTDTGGKNWTMQSTGSGDVNGSGNFQIVNVTDSITALRIGVGGDVNIGASGSAATHAVNGNLVITDAAGPKLTIKDTGTFGTNADPYIDFRDGSVVGAEVGFGAPAENNFYITNRIATGKLYLMTNATVGIEIDASQNVTIPGGDLTVTGDTTSLAKFKGNAAILSVASPDPSTNTLNFGTNAAAMFLVVNGATGQLAQFMIWGGGTSISKVSGDAVYTITSGTAASINVTNSAGTVTFQNKTGSALDLRVVALLPA